MKIRHKNNQYLISQYETIVSEYRQCLQGLQNVITINLAVSIGIITAVGAIFANTYNINLHSTIIPVFFILLQIMGLISVIACIRTIYIGINECAMFQSAIIKIENKLKLENIHMIKYYKPLHITLVGFYFLACVFGVTLIYTIATYMFASIEKKIGFLFSFIIVISSLIIVIIVSDKIYKIRNRIYKNKYKSVN